MIAVRGLREHLRRGFVGSAVVILCVLQGEVAAQQSPSPVTPLGPTEAQRAAADRLGAAVSNERIADAIRRSGLSESQIRERLQAAGMSPGLADPFFRGGIPQDPTAASPGFVAALTAMGILDERGGAPAPASAEPSTALADSRVFGKAIFTQASTTFDPVTSGPVDPSYRLGIGDNLQVIVTGEVEEAYAPQIRRDGTIILPLLGQIALAGLTLDGARTVLRQRAGQAYSGVRSGLTKVDLSIASIRSNAVFVIGEVEQPGAHQVNALATVFHALARAGGPTERGAFRQIELRRAGRVVRTLDLYEYLLTGDSGQDVRLEQGDVIFVPLATRTVEIAGAIRRPARFELREGEGFPELLRFAGGFAARAGADRVQVDRILPAAERSPGKERVLVDIRLDKGMAAATAFPLMDGDVVRVFEVGELRRNVVTLIGAVNRPGDYQLRTGMTVDSLLLQAQGLLPSAIRDRLLVRRLDQATGVLDSRVLDLGVAPGGSFSLAEFDSVEVLDVRRAYPARNVLVTGSVTAPGTFAFVERETLRDLIDRSGGFEEGAEIVSLSRRVVSATYSDTTSAIYIFRRTDFTPGGRADSIRIEPFDRVDIRLSPGYRSQRFVHVVGSFVYPGYYAINTNLDRLRDVLTMAGGPTPNASPESFQLRRQGEVVAIDFRRALQGHQDHNIVVQPEDTLLIRDDSRVVRIEGGVQRPGWFLYQPGLSVRDYIEQAGGPVDRGMPRRAVVYYPSGYSLRVRQRLWIFTSNPDVVSGVKIVVPVKPESQTATVNDVLNRTLQIASTVVSLAVAWAAINR